MVDEGRSAKLPAAVEQASIGELTSERGSLELFALPGLLVTRAAGHLDAAMADLWVRRTERLFISPHASIAIFNEWSRTGSYDSAARSKLTEWVLAHRSQVEGAWFLTGSRLVAMGVAVAGAATALAGVTIHASLDRPRWDALLRERLASSGLSRRE